jgi:hypothetical protein
MKMSQLKMVIREVVREEIRLGLKEILGGVKKQPVQKPKPKQKQHYTKNAVLNEVLNSTEVEQDWETMGGTTYTSERMADLIGGSTEQPQTDGVVVDGQTPDFLKKDYRKLMDAVDKKKR